MHVQLASPDHSVHGECNTSVCLDIQRFKSIKFKEFHLG